MIYQRTQIETVRGLPNFWLLGKMAVDGKIRSKRAPTGSNGGAILSACVERGRVVLTSHGDWRHTLPQALPQAAQRKDLITSRLSSLYYRKWEEVSNAMFFSSCVFLFCFLGGVENFLWC